MSTLYWITVLGNISDTGLILLIVLLSVAGGAGFFALINCPLDDEEYKIKTKKAFKIAKDCLYIQSKKTNKSLACLMNCFNFYNKKSILNIWI